MIFDQDLFELFASDPKYIWHNGIILYMHCNFK